MQFNDQLGRVYECNVTLATAIAFKKLGVDLMQTFDGKLWEQLAGDPELLVNVLAESVRGSLTAMNITDQSFAEALGGDSLEAATVALRDAIADFSPPLQRAAMKNLIEKSNAVQKLAADQLNRALDQLTPETIFASLSGSTSNQESSGSSQVSSVASVPEN